MWEQLQPHASLFDGAFAWTPAQFDLAQRGERQPVAGIFASGGYFATLGVATVRGRTFTPADDRPGGGADGAVAIISYRTLATALRRGRQRHRCTARRRRRDGHDRWRDGTGVPGPRCRKCIRCRVAARSGADHPRQPLAAANVTAAGHAAPEARPVGRGGHGNAPRPAAGARLPSAAELGAVHARAGRNRRVTPRSGTRRAATVLRTSPSHDPDGCTARAADRVRQHRQPAAGTRHGAPVRARCSIGAGRVPWPSRAAAAHREPHVSRCSVRSAGSSSLSGAARRSWLSCRRRSTRSRWISRSTGGSGHSPRPSHS